MADNTVRDAYIVGAISRIMQAEDAVNDNIAPWIWTAIRVELQTMYDTGQQETMRKLKELLDIHD